MKREIHLVTALLLGAVGACGSSDDPNPADAGFTVDFSLSKGTEAPLACSAVSAVRGVTVRVFATDGLTLLPGWPQQADCASGRFTDTSLGAGSYVLEVQATGDLFEDPAAVLFAIRRPITLPADRAVTLDLSPEVGFMELTWTFAPSNDLAPCADEVGDLSLSFSTGPGASYSRTRLDCAAGRHVIPVPLLPQSYTLKMEAYAQGEDPSRIYTIEVSNVLVERGQNPPFAVALRPTGGEVLFDWSFMVGAASVQACDDSRVGVRTLEARITNALGDPPLVASIPCDGQRPVRFPGFRPPEGQPWTLTLISAGGAQRFVGSEDFTAARGDTDLGLLTLTAVGSATVTVTRTSSSACVPDGMGLHVTGTAAGESMPTFVADLPDTGGMAPIVDVPLGEYRVVVQSGARICVEGTRTISMRTNNWEPFEL